MDPITIALALANIVPAIAKLIAGDSAGEVVQKIVDVAKDITGKNESEIIKDLNENPDLQDKFKDEMKKLLRERLYGALKEEFDEAEDDIKVKIDKILNEII